ncbi:unnamed protein product [Rotaria sordida]|uniref:WWE domain-containing protein n=1 Tax=Rotaria sordida TaxID=392033 RepID=A0A819RC78_9BILA|nr:unnamed protein product [Rotaria sordida]CAF4045512.1 unnamed protein product [Rotaria sordida]
MGNTPTASNNHSIRVQWMWNSSADPFSKPQPDQWNLYSDVENMIIEEAFRAGQTHAMLDDYHIDFKNNLQISNNDVNKQRPIKRMECNRSDIRLREERFMPNPIAPDRPYGGQYGFISPFIKEVVKDLNLTRQQLPSQDKKVVQMIVEKAALVLTTEK